MKNKCWTRAFALAFAYAAFQAGRKSGMEGTLHVVVMQDGYFLVSNQLGSSAGCSVHARDCLLLALETSPMPCYAGRQLAPANLQKSLGFATRNIRTWAYYLPISQC